MTKVSAMRRHLISLAILFAGIIIGAIIMMSLQPVEARGHRSDLEQRILNLEMRFDSKHCKLREPAIWNYKTLTCASSIINSRQRIPRRIP